MQLNTVIFDIDGLLIDSEPLWAKAAAEVLTHYNIKLTDEQYKTTTGLRTKEFVHWWLHYFKLNENLQQTIEENIVANVLQKIKANAVVMPGVKNIFNFFKEQQFKIGLATSSPQLLIDLVINILEIKDIIAATASAEDLEFGKPHPQVYLNCAEKLKSNPLQCICFEDSFNGMIAAKAARMKCVIVPHHSQIKEERWAAADLKLSSLQNFNSLLLQKLES
ncbi:MAG: hexitol phosphatase HxpB [Bacteroidetes bacterium]|nr:hexitol phosphatase HxpB [Bacteroidota bacterium]